MVLIFYLIENLIVHIIDIAIAGGGAFLVGRGGKGSGLGAVLLALYAMAVAGMFMGDAPRDYFGPLAAVAATFVFGFVGWRLRRKHTVTNG